MSVFAGFASELLEESEPLAKVISTLPRKIAKDCSFAYVVWTSIDVCGNWLAVGTDGGTVYVCNRSTDALEHVLTTPLVINSACCACAKFSYVSCGLLSNAHAQISFLSFILLCLRQQGP